MTILAGSASARLAQALSEATGLARTEAEFREFPDGEVYVRVHGDLAGKDVVVVNTTYPNARLIETLLLLAAAREQGARHVTAVVPYYAYSRQDVAFKPGEVVSARVIAEHLAVHADRLVTVDPHKDHVLKFFPKPASGTTAVPELAEYLRAQRPDLVLAPDKGALDRAQLAARHLGVAFDYLEKTRVSGTEVRMSPRELPVEGKTVAIIDDIISTGGTIATAAGELKRQGARRVIAACTHGLLIGGAVGRMESGGVDLVVSTDTIENPTSHVSAAASVARALGHGK